LFLVPVRLQPGSHRSAAKPAWTWGSPTRVRAGAEVRYKVLVQKGSDRILGAHLLGPDAAETINLFSRAIQHGITAKQLKSTLLAFPTFIHDVRGIV
jgi:glutathione reductase (NADPH)